jgi:hypothetical protein
MQTNLEVWHVTPCISSCRRQHEPLKIHVHQRSWSKNVNVLVLAPSLADCAQYQFTEEVVVGKSDKHQDTKNKYEVPFSHHTDRLHEGHRPANPIPENRQSKNRPSKPNLSRSDIMTTTR